MPELAFTSLNHPLDLDWMEEAYRLTRKDGAPRSGQWGLLRGGPHSPPVEEGARVSSQRAEKYGKEGEPSTAWTSLTQYTGSHPDGLLSALTVDVEPCQ